VLEEAVERAKELKGGLFAKKTFYVTSRVPIDIKLLKNVVTACGGQVSLLLSFFDVLIPYFADTGQHTSPHTSYHPVQL